jgi:flavin reductase (DIM6/NTAB) family NADH-FMN oxidoreductase RutF
MPISNDEFRSALGNFASGVTVVTTTDAAGKMHGITVSAFCSVSLEPPLVLICIEKTTASHYAFEESEIFVVNILSEAQADVSEQFAAPHPDKFDGVAFEIGRLGAPVLSHALVNLECRLRHSLNGGDHSIFVGEVDSVRLNDGQPLLYFRGDYRKLAARPPGS